MQTRWNNGGIIYIICVASFSPRAFRNINKINILIDAKSEMCRYLHIIYIHVGIFQKEKKRGKKKYDA